MIRRLVIPVFFLGYLTAGFGQEEERKFMAKPDLHFRTFWMNTSYKDHAFKEDYALGMSFNLGTILSYQKNWKLHLGYRSFANVASSEIWVPDPLTGQANRYELGLFDLLNTKDRFFGKLETFSLEYANSRFGMKAGRMAINSDWINGQDGRLSPTAVEGFSFWIAPDSNWKVTGWAIGRMSVRGSSEWLSVGNTVGIYPVGRSVSGKPAQYFGNTESDWLGIWEVDRKLGKESKLHFSNTIAHNLFATYWLSLEKNKKIKSSTWTFGFQTGFQHGIGNGGNSLPEFRYKQPGDLNYALSGRLGWKNARWITHVNYTNVGGEGRWLSPREWGKDAWYTFIPRERNEGFESVQAVVVYAEYGFQKIPLSVYGHLGFHQVSDLSDASSNKYNFPSYRQLNIGIKYRPSGSKNLDFQLIGVNKTPLGLAKLTPVQVYNKVSLMHFNAIVNWRWN